MNIRKLKNFVTKKIKAEASPNLSYHGLHHTLDVLRVCNQYCKRLNITGRDALRIRTAALVHDIGILWNYSDHEEESVGYIKEILPSYGYTIEDIKVISGMIMATQIPQAPKNLYEQIICDADLDYLGTNKFYPVARTLYEEFKSFGIVKGEDDWNQLQIRFLSNHNYHTDFAKKNRAPIKAKFLQELIEKHG